MNRFNTSHFAAAAFGLLSFVPLAARAQAAADPQVAVNTPAIVSTIPAPPHVEFFDAPSANLTAERLPLAFNDRVTLSARDFFEAQKPLLRQNRPSISTFEPEKPFEQLAAATDQVVNRYGRVFHLPTFSTKAHGFVVKGLGVLAFGHLKYGQTPLRPTDPQFDYPGFASSKP